MGGGGHTRLAALLVGAGVTILIAEVHRRRKSARKSSDHPPTTALSQKVKGGRPAYRRPTRFSHALLCEFKDLCTDLRVDHMFSRVLSAIYRLLPVERAAVFVVDRQAGVLRVVNSSDANQVTIPIDKGIAGAVVKAVPPRLPAPARAPAPWHPLPPQPPLPRPTAAPARACAAANGARARRVRG